MPNTYYKELFYNNGVLAYAGMGYERYGKFIKHGYGKLYFDTGRLFYEGDFVDGKQTGIGKIYDKTGRLKYEGDFLENKRTGKGKIYDDTGKLYYEGDFADGKCTGKGKCYLDTGILWYEGDFIDGKPTGKGKLYSETGTLFYEGEVIGGHPNGKGKFYDKSGKLFYEGEATGGHPNGRGKIYYNTGKLFYEGEVVIGKPDGKGKKYDSKSGKLVYEGNFVKGNATGKGKEYDPETGKLVYEGDFVDNKWTGKGKLYDSETGKLEYEGDFVDDEASGIGKEYDPETGELIYEGEFKDGEPVNQVNVSSEKKGLDACLEELNSMIGLVEVKAQVHALVNLIQLQNERKKRGLSVIPMSFHLVFTGNPGTGKTTVARLLSQIYTNLGIVSKGTMIETDRTGLVAGYLGQTALKTDEVINQAKGGILFIDEAYSLAQDQDQYGQEAIDCIMKRMEDYRDDFVVIAAGYQGPMEQFLEANSGLKSRFNRHIHFENYTLQELMDILQKICNDNGYTMQADCKNGFREQVEKRMKDHKFMETFSNGRYIRNLFEKMVFAQSNRLSQTNLSAVDDRILTELTVQDLQYIINNQEFEKTF